MGIDSLPAGALLGSAKAHVALKASLPLTRGTLLCLSGRRQMQQRRDEMVAAIYGTCLADGSVQVHLSQIERQSG